MKKSRYTEEQIIGVLKRMEAGQKARDLAREMGVSEATLYTCVRWNEKAGTPRRDAFMLPMRYALECAKEPGREEE